MECLSLVVSVDIKFQGQQKWNNLDQIYKQ